MEIEIYRKPTNSCTPVHVTANHPTEHKLATYWYFIHGMHVTNIRTTQTEMDIVL